MTDKTVSLVGVEAVVLGGSVTMRVKASLSRLHMQGAQLFAQRATDLEAPDVPLPDERLVEHRAYVTSAVLTAVAALESSANEFYHEVIGRESKTSDAFDDRTLNLMSRYWDDTERAPILEKYQRALIFAGIPPFAKGEPVFQDTDSLIKLRDSLVHYKPEWHDEEGRHHSLEARLKGRFPVHAVPSGLVLWFPNRCLSAGCADWATRVVRAFSSAFCARIGIQDRF